MTSEMAVKQSLQLVERLSDGSMRHIPLAEMRSVPARSGAQYALIDTSTGKSPEGLQVKRKGSSLIVESEDDGVLVEITEFYDEPETAFIPQAELDGSTLAGTSVTSESPVIDTTANGDEIIWRGNSDSDLFTPMNLGLGGLGLGGLGVAAGGGGGGGGGGGAAVSVLNTVAGTIVGGPVVAGNDLRVEVYQADGVTKLGEAQVNPDGTFSIAVGSYIGVVIARVVNNGPSADYLDEATQAGKDLNAELFAMEVVSQPNSTVIVNLNVLSTLAYHKVQDEAGGGTPTASMVDSINAAIADVFGLPSLHGTTVVPTNGGSFDSLDGLSSGEIYGAVLAALSGADAQNGGDSQQTINDLLAGLDVSNGTATLTESAQGVVVQGGEYTSTQTGQDLTGVVAGVVDTYAPDFTSGSTATAIDENSGAGQPVYTAAASDSAGNVTYSLKTVGDHALLGINASSGAVTLTGNPDFEAKANYAFTVIATDAAGNASEQAVTLGINNLDDTAPTITSVATAPAITENSAAGQVVYTVTSTDDVDVVSGATSYSLKAGGDAALFSINAATGEVTLTDSPDYETKSSYSFTVVATDAANNASEKVVTLAINDIADEIAPAVSSIAISAASGAQNNSLNVGDVVSVTVSMDEATLVDTTGGAPRVALNIGGSTVYADYVSGSGSTALVFQYTIQAGQTDTNGISLDANALQANGGSLQDAAGNAANLDHVAVADNASYLVDTTVPTFSSGATAAAIDENSGIGQTVYNAAATDAGNVTYSLKTVGDHALLGINASSGAVTLTGNPDFEAKANYAFTVIATDAAGNTSERAVTLAVNDLDELAPTVSSIAISAASGAQNNSLNAGDVVSVTVAMDEATLVDTTNGTPRVALNIGGSTAYADYVSGSGSTALVFQYTIQAGQTDANGISLDANALQANGGTLRDAAGNTVVLDHEAVADNASYLVDTTAPTARVVTTRSPTLFEPDGVTNGNDDAPQITAIGSDGAFVVTWFGRDADDDDSIFVQRFDAAGSAQGSPILLEPDGITNGFDGNPQVTALGNQGAFVVVWSGGDGIASSIFVQRFDTTGAAQGNPILLQPAGVPSGGDYAAQVTALGNNGAFAVVWAGQDAGGDYSIFVQPFDLNGVAQGSPRLIEALGVTNGYDDLPQIAALGTDGAFAVTWHAQDTDGDASVYVQRFDSNGVALNGPLKLEPIGKTNGQDNPAQITALGDQGAFAVVWRGDDTDNDSSIFLQRFDENGVAQGGPLLLEPAGVTNGYDAVPQITSVGSDGAFVVTWAGVDINGGFSVFVQRFDNAGSAQGSPFMLEADGVSNNNSFDPQVTAVGNEGAFVVIWGAQETGGNGNIRILVQRFDSTGSALGSPVMLNADSMIIGDDYSAQVSAIGSDGAFAVTWRGYDTDRSIGGFPGDLPGGDTSIFVQRFDADGSLSLPTTIQPGQAVTAQSTETGMAYLANNSIVVTNVASITGADNTLWTSVVVSAASSNTSMDTTGLADGTYSLYSVDAAGNLSAAAATTVTIDGTPPAFSSGDSATAIDENSGAGQMVYISTSSDTTAVNYSLKAGADAALFNINAGSGEVTLLANPDFESKASYSFTVVATDAAGNATEQAVSLSINDVDETGPAVSSVAITSATGVQNNTLNAGDVVNVTVTMNETTTVTGTPRVALNIGGTTVYADYVSGTGTTSLVFQYTILASQTDANGIAIAANALEANSGTLRDATGNDAVLTHALVADNASYLVDTAAPTLSSSNPVDNVTAVAVGSNIVLTFNEAVVSGSGNIIISNGVGDTRTISVTDATQVTISGNQVTINPTADLNGSSSYNIQMASGVLTDQAGNAYAGISNDAALNFDTQPAGPVNVVFDLIQGVSSDHSSRTFDANTTYTIYIRVDSNSSALSTAGSGPGTWLPWQGANNLGGDDKIVLVGNGTLPEGYPGFPATGHYNLEINGPGGPGDPVHDGISWFGTSPVAELRRDGEFVRKYWLQASTVDLWSGSWAVNANPNAEHINNSTVFGEVYLAQMPLGILTTQGLAEPV
ncbi:cadherin domain-containing protein [Pseudomonas sp. MIL19]|uniref:beta strand repeat-containing protein n=1 Tax=Pseudomonas sp. MIL19 TaxID=2976979 RepID=UPI0023649267|nr:cadherin domain-containing protein [Pseudomonas sp. MIL19]MDD2161168.1 cadherin domain-containing protein [Pseudomonas sp. MIL19]